MLFSVFYLLTISGQITYKNNCIRSGDEIIKQQVEYKDPGRFGENVIWDFSKLKAVNPEYKLSFHTPNLINDSIYIMGCDTIQKKGSEETSLIVGIEHSTMYYYRVKNDTLLCLGHENPITLMHNVKPLLLITYPFDYKQKIEQSFESKSIYSSKKKVETYGNISVESDAYGKMILPSGDTLNNVTRIKTIQIINDTSNIKKNKHPSTDISEVFRKQSQKKESIKHHKQLEAETYSWYVKGYRYPIFEAIQSFEIIDSLKTKTFTTAYFYPPVEHYYLDNDPENLSVLDSLNNITSPSVPTSWIDENFTYNYGPNPASTILNIEYNLEQEASVVITLYSSVHGIVKTIPLKNRQRGLYTETIDCSALLPGVYIIKFDVKDESVSNVILKK